MSSEFNIGDKVKLFNSSIGIVVASYFSTVIEKKLYTIKCVSGERVVGIDNDFELISTGFPEDLFKI